MLNGSRCRPARELAAAGLDDALPARRREGIEAHLRVCPRCRDGVDACLRLHHGTASRPGEPMPRRMKREILAAFRSAARP